MLIEQLSSRNLAAFKRFSEETWDRPKGDPYFQWRYLDVPAATTLMALQEGRCAASVSVFARTYHSGDEEVECLEPFDWHSAPAVKGSGIGIRLLKSLMDIGKPMVCVGGSADTLRMVPRMGWKTIGHAKVLCLPLTSRYLLQNRRLPDPFKRVIALPLDLALSSWFKLAKANSATKWACLPVAGIDRNLAHIDGPGGFRSVPDPHFFQWLALGSPVTGTYVPLALTAHGEIVAWIIARLYRSKGLLHGTILDIRVKRQDVELAQSAVRHMVRTLEGLGADYVRTITTSDFIAVACKKSGLLATGGTEVVMVWAGRHKLRLEQPHLCSPSDWAFSPLHDTLKYQEKQTGPSGVGAAVS